MPLLGAIGNASEYSFRGTYDNYPFDIDFGDIIDAEPGQIYTTILKLVEDINYKVPISISGDGEYYIGNTTFDKTFDNNYITFDQTATTFDSTFPELDYSTQPTYVRNGNTIGLRIFGVPPKILNDNITVVDRSSSEYIISLSGNLTIGLRSGDYTFTPNNLIQIDDRTFQGDEIGTEYYDKTYSTTITIGKRDFTWTVVTKKAGKAQNLTFFDANDVEYSTEIISDVYTVRGLTDFFDYTADITSNEGLLSVNYGEFVTSSPIKNGDILRLKLVSSSINATQKNTTVRIALSEDSTVGSISTTWNVATLDSAPSNLSFSDVPSAELNSQILSDIIIINGLSPGIDFDISITSSDGLLSVNGSTFVKNATIRNRDELQLRLDTSSLWLEEKNIVVKLANTSTTWKVRNRAIIVNSDANADKLIVALPYEEYYGESDATNLVRLKSGVSQTVINNSYLDYSREYDPSITNLNSKYYTSSYKMAKGVTTNDNSGGFSYIFRSEVIGRSDFTLEMWVYLTGYNFNSKQALWLYNEANYPDRSTGQGLGVLLTSNSWNTGRGKIALNAINLNQSVGTFMGETSSGNLFNINQWNHVAITRSGNLFSIYVNGTNRRSLSYTIDLQRTYFNVGEGEFSRAINEDIYIQDLRLYKGIAKYTSNFNVSNVTSIMEQYLP